MAKLAVHGTEVGTICDLTRAYRWMSDGKILQHAGSGWKLCRKVKVGVEPQTSYDRAIARESEYLAANPSYAAYRKLLHSMAGQGLRWKLHLAVSMMPDDPDGAWSDACDSYGDNIAADVDDIAQLCRAYKAMQLESRERRASKPSDPDQPASRRRRAPGDRGGGETDERRG